jgi:Outer membrane protein beta-barrel domain
MQKKIRHCFASLLGLGTLALSSLSSASPLLDKAYALRVFVPVVLNTEQEPVYGEHVENEIVKYFRGNPRFEVADKAFVTYKERLKTVYFPDPTAPLEQKLEWLKPSILELGAQGVDAVCVAEVIQSLDSYRISLLWVSTTSAEFVKSKEITVDDRYSLDSFTSATQTALGDLEKMLPFDGTLIKRDGFRVILDRAGTDLTKDQELTSYTVDDKDGKFILEETGMLKVLDVGDDVTFAKILVEKKPLEVNAGNKFLFSVEHADRDLAFSVEETRKFKSQFGTADVDLGMSIVSLSRVGSTGTAASASNVIYPGGSIHGLVWVTGKLFFQGGVDLATSGVSDPSGNSNSLSSSLFDLRGQLGYRFPLSLGTVGPTLNLRIGYGRHSFNVDSSTAPVSFNGMSFSGLLAGGGASFDLTNRWGVGFDVDLMLFPSLTETPYQSGALTTSVSGLDFNLKTYYHYSDSIDILLKLQFDSYSADFSGQGTGPVPVVSASQSGRALLAGVSYGF